MSVYVIDANTVVSAALGRNSVPRKAMLAARTLGTIALSQAVYAEITEVLTRPKFARSITDDQGQEIRVLLTSAALWVEPNETVSDCRDPGDNRYLELALAAHAIAIVSGDKDLLVLDPWRDVRIVRPARFLEEVGAGRL